MTEDYRERARLVLEALVQHYGDEEGPFSLRRARVLAADTELDEFGLGTKQLGIGTHWQPGPAETVNALARAGLEGDSESYDAALRYFALWLMFFSDVPDSMKDLIVGHLSGSTKRPERRKGAAKSLTVRDLAVFILVEDLRESRAPLETCYQVVAGELLRKRLSPNSQQTVKEIHLSIRKNGIGNMGLHHEALLAAVYPGEWLTDRE